MLGTLFVVSFCVLAVLAASCPAVSLQQQEKQTQPQAKPDPGQTPTPAPPGAKPRYDPAYEELGRATGGQAHYLDRSEAGRLGAVMEANLAKETILSVYSGLASGQARKLTVPIDSYCEAVYFLISSDEGKPSLVLRQPSGEEVTPSLPATKITELNRGRIIALARPEPGAWTVEASGPGKTSLKVTAKSELFFATFNFVQPGGRPGHEGYLKIDGPPPARESMRAELTVSSDNVADLEVSLVTDDWKTISSVPFSRVAPDAADQYTGIIQVPAEPFRVLISGRDGHGRPYQRVYGPVFRPQQR